MGKKGGGKSFGVEEKGTFLWVYRDIIQEQKVKKTLCVKLRPNYPERTEEGSSPSRTSLTFTLDQGTEPLRLSSPVELTICSQ